MQKDEQIALGVGGLVLIGFLLWKYRYQISARLNLQLCEEVSHKINYDSTTVVADTELDGDS